MKVDFKSEMKEFFAPSSKNFSLVKVPKFNYIMIDGKGDPNTSQDYMDSIQALYAVSYHLKFYSKNELDKDYMVPPLEGLWWAKDMSAFTTGKKDDWYWTSMIMVPDWLTKSQVNRAIKEVGKSKPELKLEGMRYEALKEGLAVQIMHIGPYSDEAPIVSKLHDEYLPAHKLKPNGKHHEIYLSDPRRTAPAKLKTVLRQPVIKT